MIGCIRSLWWVGTLVAGFAFATVVTVQATITIGDAVIHSTRSKPISAQERELDAPRTFEERWTFSSDWQKLRTAVSARE
jgi:hypothetical protein